MPVAPTVPVVPVALPTLKADVQTSATIAVNSKGKVLNPNFVGLSYEKTRMTTGYFSPSNKALVNLHRLLGPGVLRIGANGVDATHWDPMGAGRKSGTIAPADVDALFGFATATGWKVIYAVNMVSNTAATAADEASYVAGKLKGNLVGFEIGNEPDVYTAARTNDPNWKGYPTYYAGDKDFVGWRQYVTAIRAAVPGVKFIGPSAAHVGAWLYEMSRDASSDLIYLSSHHYVANAKDATSTAALLLQPPTQLAAALPGFVSYATNNKVPGGFRMDECNTFYNGSRAGISNSYASSLWAVRYLNALAAGGVRGFNLHTTSSATDYTPIVTDSNGTLLSVQPVYYGLFLYAKATFGRQMSISVAPAVAGFDVYSVAAPDGTLRTILLNADMTKTVGVKLRWPTSIANATAIAMRAPTQATPDATLALQGNVSLGGAQVSLSGTWEVAEVSGRHDTPRQPTLYFFQRHH